MGVDIMGVTLCEVNIMIHDIFYVFDIFEIIIYFWSWYFGEDANKYTLYFVNVLN